MARVRLRGPIRPHGGLQSDPGFLYHATNEERACAIATKGLRTHKPWDFTEQDSWPDGGREKRSYFSPKAGAVAAFAPEEGPHVILRTQHDPARFQHEGTGDIFTRKPVPATKLEIGLDEGWTSLRDWAKKNCG